MWQTANIRGKFGVSEKLFANVCFCLLFFKRVSAVLWWALAWALDHFSHVGLHHPSCALSSPRCPCACVPLTGKDEHSPLAMPALSIVASTASSVAFILLLVVLFVLLQPKLKSLHHSRWVLPSTLSHWTFRFLTSRILVLYLLILIPVPD